MSWFLSLGMGVSLFLNVERLVTLANKVEYWFNTKTQSVEVGPQSLSLDRIGPFSSHSEAERALEIITQRARAARDEDEREDWS
jgi:hypothetical protein